MISPSQSDDPRDHLVDQGFSAYTEADHDTWRTLARRQRELLKGRIADQFLDGLDRLGIGEAGIPDFREMNRTLRAAIEWSAPLLLCLAADDGHPR